MCLGIPGKIIEIYEQQKLCFCKSKHSFDTPFANNCFGGVLCVWVFPEK
jgi:hypothetical protein